MTEPIPERHYTVGDEIRVRVTFVHQANIEEVRVAFAQEYSDSPGSAVASVGTKGEDTGRPGPTITLIGEVEDTQELDTPKHGLSRRQSSALLRTLVDVDHAPGLYILWFLSFRTASGDTIRKYSTAFSRAFQIVDESYLLEDTQVELEDPDE